MDSALISVIVAVYNSEDYLNRCIDSIINNTYRNLEIILVDDGSTDSSGEICDQYAKSDSRIKVIHKENGGTAVARNTALEIAKGEYIAFADNDDFIHPKYYELMYNAIKNSNSDIVVCEVTRDMKEELFFSSNYDDIIIEKVNKHDFILGTYNDNWIRNTVPWNKLYKRKLFDSIKFPEGKGYEDAYTTYRLIYEASDVAEINAVLYYWYKNQESYSAKPTNPKKLFFREEALRLQSEFYKGKEYHDVKKAARKMYLQQLFFMYYQLNNVYEKNNDLPVCIKKFKRKLFKCYHLNFYLLDRKEAFEIFQYIYPILGGIVGRYIK